ncbi:MAG: hypothetical protein IJI14_06310 [Anaerolineaceae bacterium]|nr:hypothetical protein [Anaerolineaceae bacterium]
MKTVTIDIEKFIPLFQQCRITAKTFDALHRIENRTENMEMLMRLDGTEHRTLFNTFEALDVAKDYIDWSIEQDRKEHETGASDGKEIRHREEQGGDGKFF